MFGRACTCSRCERSVPLMMFSRLCSMSRQSRGQNCDCGASLSRQLRADICSQDAMCITHSILHIAAHKRSQRCREMGTGTFHDPGWENLSFHMHAVLFLSTTNEWTCRSLLMPTIWFVRGGGWLWPRSRIGSCHWTSPWPTHPASCCLPFESTSPINHTWCQTTYCPSNS